ncbi:MAG: hypothetical protein QOF83_1968 [Solirubrobacteraceae bacterium]|nr:hypothetical protein [Solirubrobacteraceae bacterium]
MQARTTTDKAGNVPMQACRQPLTRDYDRGVLDRRIRFVRRGDHPTRPGRSRCREAVAQLFRAPAGGYELRPDVDGVNRREGCSGPGGGEVVAVQLGEVVGRHQ